jgi:hypothetical protein
MSKVNSVSAVDKRNVLHGAVLEALGGLHSALDGAYKCNELIVETMDALGLHVQRDWANATLSTTSAEYKADADLRMVVDLGMKAVELHTAWSLAKGKTEKRAKENALKWWLDRRKQSEAFTWKPKNKGNQSADPRKAIDNKVNALIDALVELPKRSKSDRELLQILRSYVGAEG